MLNVDLIERGRETERGEIPADVDLRWEALLQTHNFAEKLGLLEEDAKLHRYLDKQLAGFEKRYAGEVALAH